MKRMTNDHYQPEPVGPGRNIDFCRTEAERELALMDEVWTDQLYYMRDGNTQLAAKPPSDGASDEIPTSR